MKRKLRVEKVACAFLGREKNYSDTSIPFDSLTNYSNSYIWRKWMDPPFRLRSRCTALILSPFFFGAGEVQKTRSSIIRPFEELASNSPIWTKLGGLQRDHKCGPGRTT
jgi:hypothetical protein